MLLLLISTHQPDNLHSVLCPQIIQTLPKAKWLRSQWQVVLGVSNATLETEQ